ncbi:MAG: HlyC/CorC family transporter [Bacteriovoracaceae bacterium]|nr:HlyC/CorC family transporter [Bacteriovoracaceae bacterium]
MSAEVQDIAVFVTGVFLSAFFSGSEAALISIPAKRVKQLMEEGGPRAKAFNFLAEKPSEILTTILIGNNFVNIFVASLATTIAQTYLESDAISYAVGITTLLILIFGEIIPKTFARNHSERLALPIIRILQVCYFIMYPAVRFFMVIIEAVLGKNAQLSEKLVTKDDIEFMVNEAEKERSIDSKQIDLLNSILEFPTIKVKDIMVPRNQVHAIKKDATYDEVLSLVREVAHSRYPVFDEDLDSTIGFLHVKDLSFVDINQRESFDVDKLVNEPFFVYEHMKIQAVFDHMNRKKVHLALVKDENGLVVGIVTLEDIMEEIFGEIQDEHDEDDDGIPKIAQNHLDEGLKVPGGISLRDLYNEYDIKIPLNDNYSTLRGFLLDMLGNNFPKEGNILFWEGLSFKLLKVEENEIEEVEIESTDGEKHIIKKDDEDEELEHQMADDIEPSAYSAK